MERKTFALDIKEIADEGTFVGHLSTFGNVDAGGDVVEPGAFKKTLREKKVFPLLWQHDGSLNSTIGTFSGKEDDVGLLIKGKFLTQLESGLRAYQAVKAMMAEGVPIGLSMGYKAIKFEFDKLKEKAQEFTIRRLKEVGLYEGSLTFFPMNEMARVEAVKAEDHGDKAEWTVAYINDLPNSAFAAIEPAYTRGDTDDKRARHLPHHDKSGKIDLPHLRNALARVNQITPITDSISVSALRAKAASHLAGHKHELESDFDSNLELKPYPNEHSCRLHSPDQYERFARMKREHNGKEYSVIIGFKKGGGSEDQAYRYPKDTWDADEARTHCKEHGGSFEAATGKEISLVCQSCGNTLTFTEPVDTTQPKAEPEPIDLAANRWYQDLDTVVRDIKKILEEEKLDT